MTPTFNLGDNYSFKENNNGNLVVVDSTGTPVIKHEDGSDSISAVAPFDAIDADVGRLLAALDANGQDINDAGEVSSDRATTDEIYGDVTNFTVLDLVQGPGLTIDSNGRLAVTAEVADNISGLSNPLVADIDAAGYDINNAGIFDGQGLRSDLQEVTSTSDLTDGEPGFYYVQNDDDVVWFDGDTSTN
jgi:hypothetical protein